MTSLDFATYKTVLLDGDVDKMYFLRELMPPMCLVSKTPRGKLECFAMERLYILKDDKNGK